MSTARKSSVKVSQEAINNIINLRYTNLLCVEEIANKTGLTESVIRGVLGQHSKSMIRQFANARSQYGSYCRTREDVIKFFRDQQQKSVNEIASLLGISTQEVLETIRDVSIMETGKKSSLTREEKRKRNEEMVRMNAEGGLSLAAIGARFNLSKQRVSDIFKQMNYKPITDKQVFEKDIEVFTPMMKKAVKEDFRNELKNRLTELDNLKQQFSMYKYNTGKLILDLRIKLMERFIQEKEITTFEDYITYKNLHRVLSTTLSQMINKTANDDVVVLPETAKIISNLLVEANKVYVPDELVQQNFRPRKKRKQVETEG